MFCPWRSGMCVIKIRKTVYTAWALQYDFEWLPLFGVWLRFGTVPRRSVVNLCLPSLYGIMPAHTERCLPMPVEEKHMSWLVCVHKLTQSFCLHSPEPPIFPVPAASLSGYKISPCGCINIHPGSSISSQCWFYLLSVIRPQAVCGVGLCTLAEKTLWEGDLRFRKPVPTICPLLIWHMPLHRGRARRQGAPRTCARLRLLPESPKPRSRCNEQKRPQNIVWKKIAAVWSLPVKKPRRASANSF